MNKSELYKIIDKLVEKRVSKIVPMLVEHEVGRLIRENKNNENLKEQNIDNKNGLTDKKKLREHFSSLIGGGSVGYDSEGTKTLSFNSQNTFPNNPKIVQGLENKPIDTSNPNVSKIMSIINRDYSSTMKAIDKKTQNRGFMPE